MKGKFITVEGGDATGKSSAIPILAATLTDLGFKVITTREPGGTVVGELIRKILLGEQMVGKVEALLLAAARSQHIEEVIKPRMEEGYVVISDRFSDSTFAYQGYGRGLIDEVTTLEAFVHEGFEPDYTLFFDAPFEVCQKRLAGRTEKQDRLDNEVDEFKKRVFEGYQARYMSKRFRMHRIDATGTMTDVHRRVLDWIDLVFLPNNKELINGT